jgi:hypothetical protein
VGWGNLHLSFVEAHDVNLARGAAVVKWTRLRGSANYLASYVFISVAVANDFYRTLPAQFRQNAADGARLDSRDQARLVMAPIKFGTTG